MLLEDATALLAHLHKKWPLPKEHLGELLIIKGLITQAQIDRALVQQLNEPHIPLGKILIDMGLLSEQEIYATLAHKLGAHFVVLKDFDVDSACLELLNYEQARKYHLLPLVFHQNALVVACSNPTDHDSLKLAEFVTGHRLEWVIASPVDLHEAIDKHYGKHQDEEDIVSLESTATRAEALSPSDIREAERLSKERPIVRLVQHILSEAVRRKASDIHVRPGEQKVDVIYRIDGALTPVKSFSASILPAVVSRIKIIGDMDISERRIAQDGRAKLSLHNKMVDLRISIMPTVTGESVVIRLLDTQNALTDLSDLGFAERDHTAIVDILNRNAGIFLVTGPTGSGKSTTLYSALNMLRKKNVNIITVENPVEYHIADIEQIQVNPKVGYTFAKILRNILRHDPDVIMIGEIRDEETAKIAIESALTGHFVLSTLHTNSAAVTVTRLLEMGIESYLITDTLLGVLAQRLVRKNCPHCLALENIDPHVRHSLDITDNEQFYHGAGCEHCNGTGYKGRRAVYELLTVSQKMKSLISKRADTTEIYQQAIVDGMTPLTHNALLLARAKVISLSEVYRIRLA